MSWSSRGRRRNRRHLLNPRALRRKVAKPSPGLMKVCSGERPRPSKGNGHSGTYPLSRVGEARLALDGYPLARYPQPGVPTSLGLKIKLIQGLTAREEAIIQGNMAPTDKCKKTQTQKEPPQNL